MRVFVDKAVSRFARKEQITDDTLFSTALNADAGIFRADLGGETFKVDIARKGRGKSSGYRAIVGLRQGHRAIYVFLWSKGEFENINENYLSGLKSVVRAVLEMDEEMLARALTTEVLREVLPAN